MTANVLVPLDGTLLAEQAVPIATSIVRRGNGHLELMLVHEASQRAGLEEWPWAVATPTIGDAYIAEQARQWGPVVGGAVGFATGDGDVATEIARRAHEVGADLVVMSSHGRTGLARTLGGSVTHDVIRRSHIPVLVLRTPLSTRHVHHPPLRLARILVAVDGSSASEAIFPAVAGIVERGATDIYLLRVVEPVRASRGISFGFTAGPMDRDATEPLVVAAERELATIAQALAERTGCEVFPHVVIEDRPALGITRFAHRYGVSLVAMTTHGRGASSLVLGSVAESVLRDGQLPMLVVRPTHDPPPPPD